MVYNLTSMVASKARQVKRGVKEVVKGIRKGEKGYAYIYILQERFLTSV